MWLVLWIGAYDVQSDWCWKSCELRLVGKSPKGILVVLEVLIEILAVKREEIKSWVQTEKMDETVASWALLSYIVTPGLG